MQLQFMNKGAVTPSVLFIDSTKITATGLEINIRDKTYLIGCSYIESMNVIWQTGTIWLGITSPNEMKMLFEAIYSMNTHQYA